MKAIIFTKYGSPDVLELQEIETPVPKDNEVLIKIHATTVTPGDCEIRRFQFPVLWWLPLRIMFGIRKPRIKILGQELAGEIEAVGKDVTKFKKGDKVFAPMSSGFGTYAQYKCLPESSVMALKPPDITFEEAAAVPSAGLNVLYFLRKVDIQNGENVLINGAAGCFGTLAVQIVKSLGAEVTAVDSTKKLDILTSIGADKVIDYTKEDFTRNGEKYDVIFDVVGKSPFFRSVKSLKKNGRYVSAIPQLTRLIQGLWTSMTSSKKVKTGLAPYKTGDLIYIKELIEAGKIKPVIDRRYPMEQIVEAHRYVDDGHKIGNVVITIEHNSNT
ncbi:MAG: NAD(P)-dependent alcohol dehydrogenase [bacterium]|nr:NAD(P)-dependent alcohol dehydrogenase [bacterium]